MVLLQSRRQGLIVGEAQIAPDPPNCACHEAFGVMLIESGEIRQNAWQHPTALRRTYRFVALGHASSAKKILEQ
jgi:hypothetical protein